MNQTNINKYPAYKDSGVEWLGEIPEGWDVLPGLRFLFEVKDKNKGLKRKTVLSLSYGKIRIKKEQELTGLVPESFETYQLVEKGDIIFRPTDLQNDHVSLRSGISEFKGIITSAYLNLRVTSLANNKFISYFFRAIDNNKIIYGLGSGLRQNIDFKDFRRLLFPFPPLPEQTAIAQFLDNKTAKIDKAIAQKERLIELLKERKQIMIQNAVTKGLNPNVKMKDSGVEWIGKIPADWEVKKMKFVFDKIKTGTTPPTANQRFFNGKINWFNPGDFKYPFLKESLKKISIFALQQNEISLFPSDSILVVGIGGTTGKTAYMEKEATFNQQITGFHSKKEYNKYFFFLISNFKNIMLETASYTTLPIINNEFFKSFVITTPPIKEQKEIVQHIQTESTKIDRAITLQEQQIEKLKEYKSVLIDSAVTGKIKVS